MATKGHRLYRSTCVEWNPSPILALTTSPDGSQVAAIREDSSLEIWCVSPGSVNWHCQMTIHGDCGSRVTSLVWCGRTTKDSNCGLILSSNVDGTVSQWDLFLLKQKVMLNSLGFSIWQMAMEPLPIDAGENKQTDSVSECCQTDDDVDDDDARTNNEKRYRRLAMACDDGSLRLYTISDSGDLCYLKTFPRVSGRVLSVEWSLDSKFLFSGSSDGFIRCWDSTTSVETYRITVGSGDIGSDPELCVWSLLFLRCGTIVSSDSSGGVQFWDSCYGTLLQTYSYHQGDANTLATDHSHKRVFSAGSDGQVIMYKMSNKGNDTKINKWSYVGCVRAHTHDVKSLVVSVPITSQDVLLPKERPNKLRRGPEKPNKGSYHKWACYGTSMLLSAGDDTKIFAYSTTNFTRFSPHDICPGPQRVPVHLALCSNSKGGSIVVTQSSNALDVLSVKLENTSDICRVDGHLTTHLLARIKSRGSSKILSSTISSSGTLLAYSDHAKPCLFELMSSERKAKENTFFIKKRKLPPGLPYAHTMIFSSDSSHIIIAGHDRKLHVVNVEKAVVVHVLVPCRKDQGMMKSSPGEPPITKMFTSSNGKWLCAINYFGDIYIFNMEIYRQYWFISRLDGASVTSGGFALGNCNTLIITTSSNLLYVFDVESKELGEWSGNCNRFMLPGRFQEFPGEVIGLSFPPSSATSVVIYSSRAMCLIDLSTLLVHSDDNLNETRNKRKYTLDEHITTANCSEFHSFDDPVLFMNHLKGNSLFVLQKPWLEVVKGFESAPVHRQIYGT